MKRLNTIYLTIAIIAGPIISRAQRINALVTVNAPHISAPPVTTLSSQPDATYQSSFRKNPLITISKDSSEANGSVIGEKMFAMKSVWELFDSDQVSRDKEDDNRNMLEVFYTSLSQELQSDPFYHIGREEDAGGFIYEEQAWDALARTLRKKYKIIRTVQELATEAENKITIHYETEGESVFKLRPGFESINGKEYAIIRLSINAADGIRSLDTRLGERGLKVRMGSNLDLSPNPSCVSLTYEARKTDDDKIEEQWEQLTQVQLTVPLW